MAVLHIIIGILFVTDFCAAQCNGVKYFNARDKGEIASPSYKKGKYPSNVSCLYKINAPKGYRIKLTFIDLDIAPSASCVSDKLEIHGRDSLIGIFCGKQKPRPVLSYEEENEMTLVFESEASSKGGRGFRIRYESAPNIDLCGRNEGVCTNRNCYDVSKLCDGKDDCGDGTDEEGCGYAVPSVTCGTTPIKPITIYGAPDRMVGGEKARANSWPWHASIQNRTVEPNGHFCTGTLIHAQWVLSSARCFPNGIHYARNIRVVLGSHRMFGKTNYEQVRMAEKIIAYPDLEDDELIDASPEDDIAMIKLNAPVLFNDGVRPVCLPYEHWKERPGWKCYTTGWGDAKGTGFSDELMQSLYEIKSVDHCSHNEEKEICVEFPDSAPCQDDTGGPLVCKLASSWYLMGTTNRPAKENPRNGLCASKESKVIFSKVAEKADWIRDTLNNYS